MYKKDYSTHLSWKILKKIRERCTDDTEIIVGGGKVGSNKLILYARDKALNALRVTESTTKA